VLLAFSGYGYFLLFIYITVVFLLFGIVAFVETKNYQSTTFGVIFRFSFLGRIYLASTTS